MLSDRVVATVVLLAVSVSFPLYLHGVWVILQSEIVTWSVLMRHLRSIVPALFLTAIPVLVWMLPRALTGRFTGLIALHIFFALQAYSLLLIGLWGIIPIFRAKRAHNLYTKPDPNLDLDELDPRMAQWRRRLRIGVFGHLFFWTIAYALGAIIYVRSYL